MFARLKRVLKELGPGLVTGASDDDPSGIATYAQAGAGFGFGALWTALFSFPLMLAVQEMSARIALVTGRGLVRIMADRTSRVWAGMVVLLLVVANTINIGADLGMMAASAQLVFRGPVWAWLFIMAGVTLLLEIFLSYSVYARYLKWLTLSLLAYVAVALLLKVQWLSAISATFLPPVSGWNEDFMMIIVAVFGTTISPYLFFWQANQEVEEKTGLAPSARIMGRMRVDTGIGMFYSNIIAWFIIVSAAVVLFGQSGEMITPDQAASVLAPIAGSWATALFALGIIGTGLLAVPILSGTTAYAFCEAFGYREGLSRRWSQARVFYGVMMVSVGVGLLMNFFGINPVRALIYAAICNAFVAPPMILFILWLANDRKVMGKWVNGFWANFFGSAAFLVMIGLPILWLWISFKR